MIGNLNKKIVLLFLSFLPLIGLGQDFDFHDIKTINSENIFKKFALENLFQRHKLDSYTLTYGYKISTVYGEGDDARSSCWIKYNIPSESFYMQFYLDNEESNRTFETIVKQIKSECTFYKINDFFEDRIYYSCPKSTYKGKIGFWIDSEWGNIEIVDFQLFKKP